MKRRTARQKVVQTLYQMDIAKNAWSEALHNVLGEDESESDPYLEAVLEGIVENITEIDTILRSSLQRWKLERLSHIDRAILRLAVFELRFREDIPQTVACNEAIELGKEFGTDESSKFINGVLSNVIQQGEA